MPSLNAQSPFTRLLRELAPFVPTLDGTLPLGLQTEHAVVDIACSCTDLDVFERALASLYVAPSSVTRLPVVPGAVLAKLMCDDLSIELFCQLLPVHEQVGFRHLVVEGQLLLVGGTELRRRVREHILAGMKTEPAFACVLGLEGDPSAALLTLATWSPLRLRHLVEGALRSEQPPAIAVHSGDRSALLPLFRLADDSDMEISGYFTRGVVFVATQRGESVGHVQMLEPIASAPTTWELKSLAVVGLERASGLGRRLVESGIDHARQRGAQRVMLSTSTADTNVLRFYQRIGFRMLRVDRDIFTPAAGYPNDVFVDGVRLLDRVWLDYRC